MAATDDPEQQPFYYGTKAELKPGDLIEPGETPDSSEQNQTTKHVSLTSNLDAAASTVFSTRLCSSENRGDSRLA